ncbi:transposase [Alkalihalobacillus sp. MEB130]|uniref:transposase n=1 Tax=Alkalihalobacillus sp. MEB130 TaxID=2976704 RepID=UPI0028DD73F8|nr:transposase [Alkalihalobacillus sp. MEB130]MDT8858873.1 transposase [Alkalihalobacillus sp. MEB130]
MGRKRRDWLPHAFYHIVSRGNRRDALFLDSSDFVVFLQILEKVYERIPYQLVSYCLMTNHFHLQLRSPEHISKVMSLVNKRYANYFNTKYKLTGHVFEKRYFSQMIQDRAGMLEVSRYIHLNPLKANLVTHPAVYHWSSFRFLYSPQISPPHFIDPNHITSYFTGTNEAKRKEYVKYCLTLPSSPEWQAEGRVSSAVD